MDVIVIGAGASGLVAAIKAAEKNNTVTVLEHLDKIGKKLLATGNGRCNLTNKEVGHNILDSYICNDYGKRLLKAVFESFGYDSTISLFEELGLMLKYRGNLVYPYSDQAQAVLDVLYLRACELGVKFITGVHVDEVMSTTGGFVIKTVKAEYSADKVIVATGSMAQPALGSDGSGYELLSQMGHNINSVLPGLVQMKCEGALFKDIQGVRVPAKVTLRVNDKSYSESGELQLTSYGISGIVVMNLSNYLGTDIKNAEVCIDLLEEYTEKELMNMLIDRCRLYKQRYSEHLLTGIIPKKLAVCILNQSGIGTHTQYQNISDVMCNKLAVILKNWKLKVVGTNGFKEAQICLGGIKPEELTEQLESKVVKGLFVTGELIDIHGACGGYNLQWAFSSGAVAGMSV